jgi:hypothetical protein
MRLTVLLRPLVVEEKLGGKPAISGLTQPQCDRIAEQLNNLAGNIEDTDVMLPITQI